MRKFAAVVAVSMLAMTACKSSSDTSTDATDTTTGSTTATTESAGTDTTEFVSTDNRAPGVSDSSIKVGIGYMVFTDSMKKQLRTWHGDYKAFYQAVIDQINEEGGVHGRTLEPVFAEIQLGVDGMDDAACTALTEDNEVFVALGYFSGGDQAMCFLDTHETAVIGGAQSDELRAQAKAPWFTTESGGGDAEGAAIQALVDADLLGGKLAVLGTSDDVDYFDAVSRGILSGGDVDIVSEAFPLVTGTDTAADQAVIDTAIQAARAAGAETLLFVGQRMSTPGLDVLVKTDWRPTIRFSNRGSVGMFDGDASRDRSVLDGAQSAGVFDYADVYLEMTDEGTTWCIDALESRGIELSVRSTWTFESGLGKTWTAAGTVCQQVQVLRAILEAAGPNLDYGTFQHAGDTLGEVQIFGDPNPRTYGAGSGADGDPKASVYMWDASTMNWLAAE